MVMLMYKSERVRSEPQAVLVWRCSIPEHSKERENELHWVSMGKYPKERYEFAREREVVKRRKKNSQ
jgi:hypothetical protein